MTFLLDTSIVIDVLRTRNNRRVLLIELTRQGHLLSTSAVSIAEVHAGMRPNERQTTESFLAQLHCHPITATIASRAGDLKNSFARQGITAGLPDMLVAATAMEHNLTLITDNRKHFLIPGLTLHPLA